MADPLFAAMFSTPAMSAAVSGRAWVRAMLEVEAALASAEAACGVIPQSAAEAIIAGCRSAEVEPGDLAPAVLAAGNPAGPLLEALRARLPPEAADYLHWGATSQDVVDSAMMLVAREALKLLLADLELAAGAAARLADEHRGTIMAGRTLLQQAVPITFGLKAAGWLGVLVNTYSALVAERADLPVQLGGAAGTLAALGGDGPAVVSQLARELGLREPVLPWHTSRRPVAELAAQLGLACSAAGKIALDVTLLSQTEVGEVREAAGGSSSAMPHKRNPTQAVAIGACLRQAQALAPLLVVPAPAEQERAAGAWQAEWTALSSLLEVTGAALAHTVTMLDRLIVERDRMRANLGAADGGLLMSESLLMALARVCGLVEARRLVDETVARALSERRSLTDAAIQNARIVGLLGRERVLSALEPNQYLGANDILIDRALDHYRASVPQADQ
jgi:3-carboxy-cis,cis-muconate cycloisomerase